MLPSLMKTARRPEASNQARHARAKALINRATVNGRAV